MKTHENTRLRSLHTMGNLKGSVFAVGVFIMISFLLVPDVGYSQPPIVVPVRWCFLEGAPSFDDPSLVGQTEANIDEARKLVLWKRHERVTNFIYFNQANITFRSAATFKQPEFPMIEDQMGAIGQVMDPQNDKFKEFNDVLNRCRMEWEDKDPEIKGIVAVQIDRFTTGGLIGWANNNGVVIIDNAYTLPGGGLPLVGPARDPVDKWLGHELGHRLGLPHGDGLDDSTITNVMGIFDPLNGKIDDGNNNGNCTVGEEPDNCGSLVEDGVVNPITGLLTIDRNLMESLIPMDKSSLKGKKITTGLDGDPNQVKVMVNKINTDDEFFVLPGQSDIDEINGDSAVDALGDANRDLSFADINRFGVVVNETKNETRLSAAFNDLLPDSVFFQTKFFADTDQNSSTGGDPPGSSGPTGGIELFVNVGISVLSGNVSTTVAVFQFDSGLNDFVAVVDPGISVEVTTDVAHGDDPGAGESVSIETANGITITIPSDKIAPFNTAIDLEVRTDAPQPDGGVIALDDARASLPFTHPVYPSCEVDPEQVSPGDNVQVKAFDLPVESEVMMLLGDQEVATGFTDTFGFTELSFNVPADVVTGKNLITIGVKGSGNAITADCGLMFRREVGGLPSSAKCYFGKQIPPFTDNNPQLPFPTIARVTLNDQFASRETDVRFLKGLCNPAGKNEEVNPNRMDHLSCYSISDAPGQPLFFPGLIGEIQIETENFGEDTVKLGHALELCVSANKNGQFADIVDFKCYSARSSQQDFPEITLDDQFFANKPATIKKLSRFCTPVGKNQPAPPENPEAFDHLACYDIGRDRLQPQIGVNLTDQFIAKAVGQDITFTTEFERRFCEPARKISVASPIFAKDCNTFCGIVFGCPPCPDETL